MSIFDNIFNRGSKRKPEPDIIKKVKDVTKLPRSRQTQPDIPAYDPVMGDTVNGMVADEYIREVIPHIRKISKITPDLKLALKDAVELINTSHKISFGGSVTAEQADEMRLHLNEVTKHWLLGTAGINGIIDRLIRQIKIGGALSIEVIPNRELTGVHGIAIVDPEFIYFRYNKSLQKYEPYQLIRYAYNHGDIRKAFKKLNQNTYLYIGVGSDIELPTGEPEFMAALNSITTQKTMTDNINFVVSQVGLMGFFEALLDKPDQRADENEAAYKARLESLLTETKTALGDSMRDGITVGYKDDHEFNFHSTTKDIRGLAEIFNQNEIQVANGIGTAPLFLGVDSKSDTGTNILFTKLVSQLNSTHDILARALEFMYSLELRLAGYSFDSIIIEFDMSTVADTLKKEQANEYKIRNLHQLYADGIISLETYAHRMGEGSPDQKEPRLPLESVSEGGLDTTQTPKDRADTKTKKTDAQKKTDDKRKTGTPKDNTKNK